MNKYINSIESAMIKIEVNYQCSIHKKSGTQFIKKFKSKPKNWNLGNWQSWQYPKQDELCPDCRREEIEKRHQEKSKEYMKIWFDNKTPQQKQDLIQHQKNLEAEKQYEEELRCRDGFVSQAEIIDYKKKLIGDD
jgi:hypothetical protein